MGAFFIVSCVLGSRYKKQSIQNQRPKNACYPCQKHAYYVAHLCGTPSNGTRPVLTRPMGRKPDDSLAPRHGAYAAFKACDG